MNHSLPSSIPVSPRLPQELIDEIISHLSDDQASLTSLQFVSKACLDTARHYALAKFTVTLHDSSSYETFAEDVTSQYSHLARYISYLTIIGTDYFFGETDQEDLTPTHVLSPRIIPDSLLKLLSKLTSLTVSRVWLAQYDVVANLNVYADDAFGQYRKPSFVVPLKKLCLKDVSILNPVDFTFAEIIRKFPCSELHVEGINRDFSVQDPYPSHINTVTPGSALTVFPTTLIMDGCMLRAPYVDLLQRITSSEKLVSLELFDLADNSAIQGLGSYLNLAHASLTRFYIREWVAAMQESKHAALFRVSSKLTINYPILAEDDMWEQLHLSSFVNLREVSITVPVNVSSTTHTTFIWNSFYDFIQHLPTKSIHSLQIILEPDNPFLGSHMGVLGHIPEQFRITLDTLFKRFLPTLKRCTLVWVYHIGREEPMDFNHISSGSSSPERYLDEIRSLLPSLDAAGVLQSRRVDVPVVEVS
ncbi:hypothetical protein K474DRAFT_1706878 [Panus rudis PR-1116 ss-1]|nr:hypothetical protein K474DRAFT_1706878 [Panus rudis PR-1116 ss-1]